MDDTRTTPHPFDALSGQDWFELAQRLSDESVWHWDIPKGTLHWSPGIASLLGITKAISVLSGDPFQTFLHPDDLKAATHAISAHLKKGTPYILEERLLTADGTHRWFLVRGKAQKNAAGRPIHMTGYLCDIHALKEASFKREQQLMETRKIAVEMAALNELSRALATRLTLNEVAEEAYKQTARLIDTSNFAISLYNPEQGELEFIINVTESEIDKEELTKIPSNAGISGYILHNRVPVLLKDGSDRWLTRLGVKAVGDHRVLSWLGVPILLGDQILGIIMVQNYRKKNVYGEHDQELLTTIASSIAIAIQNARLFAELEART